MASRHIRVKKLEGKQPNQKARTIFKGMGEYYKAVNDPSHPLHKKLRAFYKEVQDVTETKS